MNKLEPFSYVFRLAEALLVSMSPGGEAKSPIKSVPETASKAETKYKCPQLPHGTVDEAGGDVQPTDSSFLS